MELKILKRSGSVYSDYSSLRDYYGSAKSISLSNTEYLYLGSPFKFNQFYIKFSVLSTVSNSLNIELFDGVSWQYVSSIEDGTNGFKNSGHVSFIPDKYKTWQNLDSNFVDSNMPMVYEYYWLRISVTSTLSPVPSISFIGHLFLESDNLLSGEFPNFANASFMTAFKTGKTDWEEQRYLATNLIIERLIQKNILVDGNQLLDIKRLRGATIQKTAQLIFNSMGDDYLDQANGARDESEKRLHGNLFLIDDKNTAIVDNQVRTSKQGYLTR